MKNLRTMLAALLLLCSTVVMAQTFEVGGIYYTITSEENKTVEVTHSPNYNYAGDIVIPEKVSLLTEDNSYVVDSYDFWSSINGYSTETSYSFNAQAGDFLYFEYYSNTPNGEDYLTINLDGETIVNTYVNSNYGNLKIMLDEGYHYLFVQYKKVSAYSYSESYGEIYNIQIRRGTNDSANDYSVTTIGDNAFHDCSGLTSITIPNSVTTIGDNAFYGTSWYNNQPYGVVYAGKVLYKYKGTMPQNTSIAVNEGTLGIVSSAFSGCSGLTSITIPNSVTNIGSSAFSSCSGLTSINIPNSVTSIGNSAFYYCTGLTSIVIPNSVTTIGNSAFQDCSGLTSVTIPNSVTNIGSSAFYGCDKIDSLNLNCETIGNWFGSKSSIKNVVLGDSVRAIASSAFYGCTGLTEVRIGNSVTNIGSSAFYGCNKIDSLNLNCETIGNWFSNKSSIKKVVLGDSVRAIGNSAFSSCSGLTSINIPNSVTSIGNSAFSSCSGLTSINIPNSVTNIGSSAFQYCSGLTSINIPNSVTNIGSSAFYGCDKIDSLNLNCETIGNWFRSKSSIKKVVLGDSVRAIGSQAFYSCSGLTSINIPNSVTTIGSSAFQYCSGLTSINIPNSVTNIGSQAFYNCTGSIYFDNANIESSGLSGNNFKKVVLSPNVTSIENGTSFSSVSYVTAEGTTPATITSPFSISAVIYVPTEAYTKYCKTDGWKNYLARMTCEGYDTITVEASAESANSGILTKIGLDYVGAIRNLTVKGSINSYDIIQFRDKMPLLQDLDLSETTVVASSKPFYNGYCTGENSLGAYTFYGLGKLRSIKLPKDITSIGSYMFNGCSNLTNVEIPSTVKSIGTYAFYNCDVLIKITLPNKMNSIGNYAFYDCDRLNSIAVPDGVKAIESYTFYSCDNLKSVTLPNGLESIGNYAFYYCSKLQEIKLPPTVKTIGSYAFQNNTSLTELHLPASITSIGSDAFNGCSYIKSVYTYTVEPTTIQESTFSCYNTATLYVPSVSFYNYYWDEKGWKRFLNIERFDGEYEYFYVNDDFTLNDNTGYIEGTEGKNPDLDINPGGSLVVEGEQGDDEDANQHLGNVNVNNNGEGSSGSIIADNNLQIDSLNIRITVKGGRWYFLAFPYDIPLRNIKTENGGDYVFRYYDGEERATNGNGGWKEINENHLKAARGYIFQCSQNDVLVLSIANLRMKKEDKYIELMTHVSSNMGDASWNFAGNPYISYYDIADTDYSAPITVWDGSKYVAIRPGDDVYHFNPFEAFFVQKPQGTDHIGFQGEKQMTSKQSKEKKQQQQIAQRAKIAAGESKNSRLLVNIVLSNEEQDDRTRIVFNEQQTHNYESSCDAAKFETAGVPQIYTIDDENVHYAINERPAGNGIVKVGYSVVTEGTYTIEAQRMDVRVYILDKKEQYLHSFDEGAYTFTTTAGKFEERFEIMLEAAATDIEDVNGNNDEESTIHDLMGRRVKRTDKGVYIIDGEKVRVK